MIDDDAFIRFRDGGLKTLLDFRSPELARNAPNKIRQDIIIFDVG